MHGQHVRHPHAVLDVGGRHDKARKIERLLDLHSRAQPIRLLEVGTGSGAIAHYFGTHPGLRCDVHAVDVVDNRLVHEGYAYHPVGDTTLPFEDGAFDVVLTNHVIEHVGLAADQLAHLREVRRVMAAGGVGYLAVPNRWMLVEPHYRLAFLSWLPRSLRSPYLRKMGKGDVYDCEPLTVGEIEALLRAAGFQFENICVAALRATLDIEQPESLMARTFEAVPDAALGLFKKVIPTLIYRFRPPGAA